MLEEKKHKLDKKTVTKVKFKSDDSKADPNIEDKLGMGIRPSKKLTVFF